MKDQLKNKTVSELRALAKDLNIVGRWDMNKEQLVEAIEEAQFNVEVIDAIDNEISCTSGTDRYIGNLEEGMLVAFTSHSKKGDKVLTGKFVSKVVIDGKTFYQFETKMKSIFNVVEKDILWVRTGTRWPKWVYQLFEKRGA